MSGAVRVGVIGVGNMGRAHAEQIQRGEAPGLELAAVCDTNPERTAVFEGVRVFGASGALIGSGEVDAVVIATPHYDHLPIGVEALSAGLHVLVEKPIAVHKADAQRLIDAHRRDDRVFAAMFNQRTDPRYRRLRTMITSGELGEIRRVNWIITDWFRSQRYYDSGGWRATWRGEGGGVLLNQCPHNLDLMQWLFGMPARVTAFCEIGRYHDIEVEDDVTAYLEYENGASAVFITTTGETPGTNRLEVTAEQGKVVIEGLELRYQRNDTPMSRHCRTTTERFKGPATEQIVHTFPGRGEQHGGVLRNFARAVLDGEPLIADAREGIRSVELGNAMLYSGMTRTPVDLPMDAAAYETHLDKLIAGSRFEKRTVGDGGAASIEGSF